jgi:hypothetical protein
VIGSPLTLHPSEIVFLAYSSGQAGQVELADDLFDMALVKLSETRDPSLVSDIYRLKATQTLNAPSGVDVERVRTNFGEAVRVLSAFESDTLKLQLSNSMFEWAMLEMSYGDWDCGRQIGNRSLEIISRLPSFNPQVAMYANQYRRQLEAASSVRGGPPQECQRTYDFLSGSLSHDDGGAPKG